MITKELLKIATLLDDPMKKLAAVEDDHADKNEPQYKILRLYRPLLQKMVGTSKDKVKVEAINKLKYILDNKRIRKPDRYWIMALDRNDGSGSVGDLNEWIKQLNYVFKNKLPTARILKIILDYGVENGYQKLKQVLENNQARVKILGEEEKGVETKWTKDKKKASIKESGKVKEMLMDMQELGYSEKDMQKMQWPEIENILKNKIKKAK